VSHANSSNHQWCRGGEPSLRTVDDEAVAVEAQLDPVAAGSQAIHDLAEEGEQQGSLAAATHDMALRIDLDGPLRRSQGLQATDELRHHGQGVDVHRARSASWRCSWGLLASR
jgi:hypothetical protein